MKDSIQNVTKLISKIRVIIKKATGASKLAWKEFLKECRSFVKNQKRILSLKYKALRFAASEEAEKLHSLLCNRQRIFRDLGEQLLVDNWAGYLLWVEKSFRDKDYSHRAYMEGGYWTGKFYEAGKALSTKMIKKIALWYKKSLFSDAKITIKMGYNEYRVNYKNKEDEKAAVSVAKFLKEFSYNFNNSMADYFDYGYTSRAYFVG